MIIQSIEAWILNELSIPSAETNNIPLCPYAKKAWLSNEVKVVWQSDLDLWKTVFSEVDMFDDSFKVVICAVDEWNQTYEETENYCFALNARFAHEGKDIWLLAFEGDYTMIFIQRLSHLDNAAAWLEKMGYYKQYDPSDYEKLIADRRDWRKYDEKTYA